MQKKLGWEDLELGKRQQFTDILLQQLSRISLSAGITRGRFGAMLHSGELLNKSGCKRGHRTFQVTSIKYDLTFVNVSLLCNILPHPSEVATSDLCKCGGTNPH
jgi:hypothetical protein